MGTDDRPPQEGPSHRKRGRPPHPDILTPREWQVLHLVREGLTNEQIAQRLDISFATAKYHVAEIISKLGVQTREEAAAWQPDVAEVPWWQRAMAPLSAALRRLGPITIAKAAIAAGALTTLAGLAAFAIVLSSRSNSEDAQAVAKPTAEATRRASPQPARTNSQAPTAVPTPAITPEPIRALEPVTETLPAVVSAARLRPDFPIPTSEGMRLVGGLYMAASDASGLAALALPDDPAAGAHFGFSAHSISPDGRWLAYSPRPPRNGPDAPPGQTLFLRDMFESAPAVPVAGFSRIWGVDVSPGGTQIIVSGTLDPSARPGSITGEYFLVDVGTSSIREFPGLRSAHGAHWSPTGERILGVFSGAAGGSTLKFFSTDGGELLSLDTPYGNLAWSPDGSRLALSTFTGGTTGIYVIGIDGSTHYVSDVPPSNSGLSWSPDGNHIALTYSAEQPAIGVLDMTTTEFTPLVPGESPAWSHDGTRIAFVDAGQLRVVDLQTGQASQPVAPAQPLVAAPHWLADDVGLVFHYAPWFLHSIRSANPDGTIEQHIAYGDGPAWSPDSRQIAFFGRSVSFGFTGFSEVYVMDRDGSAPHKIGVTTSVSDVITCTPPGLSWSEDGARVIYYDPSQNGLVSAPASGDAPPQLVSQGCPPSVGPTPTPDVIPSPSGDQIIVVR